MYNFIPQEAPNFKKAKMTGIALFYFMFETSHYKGNKKPVLYIEMLFLNISWYIPVVNIELNWGIKIE